MNNILLTIAFPTTPERKESFNRFVSELEKQIQELDNPELIVDNHYYDESVGYCINRQRGFIRSCQTMMIVLRRTL